MRCPHCTKDFDPRDAIAEGEWKEIISLWPKFGAHARLVMEYCELFGVSYTVPKKLLRLLREMQELLQRRQFKFERRVHVVEQEVIIEALKTMCNRRFDRPLPNHNYLYQVLITESAKVEKKKSGEREAYLRDREAGAPRKEESENRRDGEAESDDPETAKRKTREALEESRRRRGVTSLVDAIGKAMP